MVTTKGIHGLPHTISATGVKEFHDQVLEPASNASPPSPFERSGLTNLASAGNGAKILFATDEWFAEADNLLKDTPPIFDPEAYCEQGKVMDGFESKRRREAGHDWCIIKLSARATLLGLEVDTAHFTGNHVPAISLQVADLTCTQETAFASRLPNIMERLLHGGVIGTSMNPREVALAEEACQVVEWKDFLPKTPLRPGYESTRMHYFTLETPVCGTHLRLNYFPDGGVARLRIWGTKVPEKRFPKQRPAYTPIVTGRTCTVVSHSEPDVPSRLPYAFPELSCETNGGEGLLCSNKHYGTPWNLIQEGPGRDMGDGWETARHPSRPSILVKDPKSNLVASSLMDWCVIKLGQVAGNGVSRVILDTKYFRGNYPESVLVEGCYVTDDALNDVDSVEWFPLVPRGRMAPDSEHVFDRHKGQILNGERKVSHVKVSIYPDGGLSRVRVYGATGDVQ